MTAPSPAVTLPRLCSNTQRSPFSRSRPQTPQSPQSAAQSGSPVQDDNANPGGPGPGGSLQGLHKERGISAQPSLGVGTAASEVTAAVAVCAAKQNLKSIWHEKNKSDESIHGKPSDLKQQNREQLTCLVPAGDNNADAATAAQRPKSPCCGPVPAAPPSELKYGDRLRLWVR